MADRRNEEDTAPPTSRRRPLPDMFEGPVLRLLARLASPIFFGMLFQLLYKTMFKSFIQK